MAGINFAGLASGIDTNALIKAQSDAARRTKVTPAQTKVSELTETNTAFNLLKTRLNDIRDKLSPFTTLNAGGISKIAASSDDSKLSATSSNAAANGSYTISTITSRAKNHTTSFNDTYSSESSALNGSINNADPVAGRTISVVIGSPAVDTVNLVITNTTTLSDVVNTFNNDTSSAVASIVNTGTAASPLYKLFISSNSTGTAAGTVTITNGASVGALGGKTEDAATNAVFTLAGNSGTITRASNTVSDVITGVTFDIRNTSVSPITLTVADDTATTIARVQDFITSYNKLVTFVQTNNQVTREEDGSDLKNIFAPLANSRTDDGALQTMRSAISGTNYSSGTSVKILADLGITSERDGTLKFDSAVLTTAVATEASSVNQILRQLADTVALTNGTVDSYTKFNGLIDTSITANSTQITDLNSRITQAELAIAKQEDSLKSQFARLEAVISKLQDQQRSLSSALGSLGG